jgi:hypothetical protein
MNINANEVCRFIKKERKKERKRMHFEIMRAIAQYTRQLMFHETAESTEHTVPAAMHTYKMQLQQIFAAVGVAYHEVHDFIARESPALVTGGLY